MSKYILTTYNVLTEQVKVYYPDKIRISAARICFWKDGKFEFLEREVFQYSLIEVEDYNLHIIERKYYEN